MSGPAGQQGARGPAGLGGPRGTAGPQGARGERGPAGQVDGALIAELKKAITEIQQRIDVLTANSAWAQPATKAIGIPTGSLFRVGTGFPGTPADRVHMALEARQGTDRAASELEQKVRPIRDGVILWAVASLPVAGIVVWVLRRARHHG